MIADNPPVVAGFRAGPVLLAVAVALFALRALLGLTRTGPILFADEAGYLGAARLLSGGMGFHMGSSPFYRPGYGLLLAPLTALDIDPQTTYVLVVVVNALLAASLVGLLYLLLRGCFDQAPAPALGGAIVGAAYPTVSSITQIANSENALFPLTVVWLLAFGMLLRARGAQAVLSGVSVGACAAVLFVVHGRMIVLVLITAVALVALAARRRIAPVAAVGGLAVLVAGLVVAGVLNAEVIDNNYAGRDVDEIGDTLGAVDSLGAVGSVLRNLVGATWYLLVATFGLIAVCVAATSRETLARLLRRDFGTAELCLGLLLAGLLGLLVLSSLWFVDATRPDQLVYGRYVEPVVPPLLALAVAMLATRSLVVPVARVVGAIAALTVAVAALRSGVSFVGEDANRWSTASMPFVTADLQPAVIAGAGVVAAGGAFVLSHVSLRAPARLWLVLLALFVPVTAFTQVRLIARVDAGLYPAGWTSPQPVVEAHGAAVAYDTAHYDGKAVKVVQWFLPHTRFETFDGAAQPPPAALVFSGAAWFKEHPQRPATILWRDPGRDQVLWKLGPEP